MRVSAGEGGRIAYQAQPCLIEQIFGHSMAAAHAKEECERSRAICIEYSIESYPITAPKPCNDRTPSPLSIGVAAFGLGLSYAIRRLSKS